MASAWGSSWGSAWGNSWGSIQVTPPPDPGTVSTTGTTRINLIGPQDQVDDPTIMYRLFDMLEQLRQGRSVNQGTVTLVENTTTTVVNEPLFESHQIVQLYPFTADAAAEVAGGQLFISARANGNFTITHSNSASTTRIFGYTFVGSIYD